MHQSVILSNHFPFNRSVVYGYLLVLRSSKSPEGSWKRRLRDFILGSYRLCSYTAPLWSLLLPYAPSMLPLLPWCSPATPSLFPLKRLCSLSAPLLRPPTPPMLPLKRPCSLSRSKTAIANPKFGVYIIYISVTRQSFHQRLYVFSVISTFISPPYLSPSHPLTLSPSQAFLHPQKQKQKHNRPRPSPYIPHNLSSSLALELMRGENLRINQDSKAGKKKRTRKRSKKQKRKETRCEDKDGGGS